MPSSRQSSLSSRTSRLPAWRTISLTKNSSSAPGLSYVFAEPERGSPLSPAVSQLSPGIATQDIGLKGDRPRSRSRLSSTSSSMRDQGGGGDDQNNLESRIEAPRTVSQDASSLPKASSSLQPPPEPQNVPEPTSIPDSPTRAADKASHQNLEQISSTKSEITVTSKQAGVSWFGSLSRRKGRYNIAQTTLRQSITSNEVVNSKEPVDSMPSLPDGADMDTSSHSTPTASLPTPPDSSTPLTPTNIPSYSIPLSSQPSPRRSWFSSPRPDLSATRQSTAQSIPSSIDEEVPALPSISTSPVTSPTAIIASPTSSVDGGAGLPSISTLNPSTSRFSLGVPLLGRPKQPLEKVSMVIHAEYSTTTSKSASEPTENKPQTTDNQTTPEQSQQPPLQTGDKSGPNDQASETNATGDNQAPAPQPAPVVETIQSTSSWLSYIGWTSSQPTRSSPSEVANQTPAESGVGSNTGNDLNGSTMSEGVPNTTQRDEANVSGKAGSSSVPSNRPDEPKDPEGGLSAGVVEGEPKEEGKEQTPTATTATDASHIPTSNVQSAESHDSAWTWYNPLKWYSPSMSALGSSHPAGNTESTEPATTSEPIEDTARVTGEGEPQLSQAEMVKEAALARQGVKAQEEDGNHRVETNEGLNPVESSISTHRSGWASFFSSKSLVTKVITGNTSSNVEVDENGMEVMDVDGEESEAKTEEQQRGRSQDKIKPIDTKVASKVTTVERRIDKHDVKTAVHKAPASPRSPTSPASTSKGSQSPAPLITISDSVKREVIKLLPDTSKEPSRKPGKKSASPSPSTKSSSSIPAAPQPPRPNLVLPNWDDIFHTAPRSLVPPPPPSTFRKTMKFVSGILFDASKSVAGDGALSSVSRKGKSKEPDFTGFGKELPRAWDVMEKQIDPDVLRGCRRVVVIGVHGWFPGAVMRSVIGEPTGTSGKFVSMMVQALEEFQEEHAVRFEKITSVPLEGEGTIDGRVSKLYGNLLGNQEWMNDLHAADVIFVATHSQGSIVSTHLLDCLIRDHHIKTAQSASASASQSPGSSSGSDKVQRVCCLALCGIHLGPLRYLSSSSLLQPYFQYFESAAARELFEFQNTESEVSQNYVKALRNVLDHGTKMVYVASLNDQVVPIYSGLFTAASHPLILRALYIDGDAYHSSDFLSNLLVLLLRIFNSGISDSGLTVHLSEATAGSLNGVGHSTAYEEISTYSLAVKYLFLTNNGSGDRYDLNLEPFDASKEQNDYEIPWSLRDVIADDRVEHFFSQDISKLRDAFRDWHPKTTVLRDLKRKLQPIQRLPSSVTKL